MVSFGKAAYFSHLFPPRKNFEELDDGGKLGLSDDWNWLLLGLENKSRQRGLLHLF
jgi:hypothetical protein